MPHLNTSALKRITLVATLAYMFFGSQALANTSQTNSLISNNTLMNFLKPYYPFYNKKLKCQSVVVESSFYGIFSAEDNKAGHCVEIDRQVVVETNKGKRLYVLVAGDIKFGEHEEGLIDSNDALFYQGLVGMFVLKPNGNNWKIESASPIMSAGAQGMGLRGWKLMRLAPDTWGFINEDGYEYLGYVETSLVILTPNGQNIIKSSINNSNFSAYTDLCSDEVKRVCDDIKAKLQRIDTSKVVDGFYPLSFMINGRKNNKTYKNANYTFFYKKGQGYQIPDNYPIGLEN
ncbi:hypothetical protein IQ457_01490 [Psychrobacter sp. M9-54-1]|uniref:hypothetical protein n=1 Tax=Psychrobacter sp. M9-54-1 TaxID=2782386 RepID=UPI00190CE1EE|nr:hypothetical protein [Psychrobacter sp. M9-54-1]MBK3392623.1 hypothetical protein [Psychrobacter sp. M9-54-1]